MFTQKPQATAALAGGDSCKYIEPCVIRPGQPRQRRARSPRGRSDRRLARWTRRGRATDPASARVARVAISGSCARRRTARSLALASSGTSTGNDSFLMVRTFSCIAAVHVNEPGVAGWIRTRALQVKGAAGSALLTQAFAQLAPQLHHRADECCVECEREEPPQVFGQGAASDVTTCSAARRLWLSNQTLLPSSSHRHGLRVSGTTARRPSAPRLPAPASVAGDLLLLLLLLRLPVLDVVLVQPRREGLELLALVVRVPGEGLVEGHLGRPLRPDLLLLRSGQTGAGSRPAFDSEATGRCPPRRPVRCRCPASVLTLAALRFDAAMAARRTSAK